jgi:hypothetical protein
MTGNGISTCHAEGKKLNFRGQLMTLWVFSACSGCVIVPTTTALCIGKGVSFHMVCFYKGTLMKAGTLVHLVPFAK